MPAEKIAFIAGRGELVTASLQHCIANGYDVHVLGLLGHFDEAQIKGLPIAPEKIAIYPPEKLGAILDFFKSNSIKKLVMIGNVERPSILSLRPDYIAFKVIAKYLMTFIKGGDDRLLRALKAALEEYDLTLVGLHKLWPNIVAPSGMAVHAKKAQACHHLIKQGWHAAKQHGDHDKGQSVCIFPDGKIYKEDKKGTNHLILESSQRQKGDAGILIKTSKPQQDLDLDMPTIGPETINQIANAGFQGLVIEVEKTILYHREAIIRSCQEKGLFFLTLSSEDIEALS